MKKTITTLFLIVYLSVVCCAQESEGKTQNSSKTAPLNINISLIGSLITALTDDAANQDKGKPVFSLGETELFISGNLNPYSRAQAVVSIEDGEGDGGASSAEAKLEEAFIEFYNNLPVERLSVKAGKYRAGFGRLNQYHPHMLPFIEAPRALSQFLPGGEEGYKDTGFGISYLMPVFSGGAATASFDVLSGKPFHPEEASQTAYAYIARLNTSFMLADAHPLELGVSWMRGANSVEFGENINTYGADFKTKLYFSALVNLVLQGEFFCSRGTSVEIVHNPGFPDDVFFSSDNRYGFYALASLGIGPRWNLGFIYDQYRRYLAREATDRALKAFAGFSLMEETAVLRLAAERYFPHGEEAANTLSFQILFSMGPHKVHKF